MALKRKKIGIFRRIKAGWKCALTVATTETGIVSPFIASLDAWGLGIFGGAVAITSTVGAYLYGKQKHLPALIVEEVANENHYTVGPSSSENLRIACDETESLFGRDAVEFAVLEKWRTKCPEGFLELVNNAGEFCGCFILLPLIDSFTNEFLAGRVTENQICPDVIHEKCDWKRKKRIYICGIMVVSPETRLGHKRAAVLISAIIKYIRQQCGESKRTFFTVPVTREGEILVKNLGFTAMRLSEDRVDKHTLYSLEVSREVFAKLRSRLGDYSQLVEFKGS